MPSASACIISAWLCSTPLSVSSSQRTPHALTACVLALYLSTGVGVCPLQVIGAAGILQLHGFSVIGMLQTYAPVQASFSLGVL